MGQEVDRRTFVKQGFAALIGATIAACTRKAKPPETLDEYFKVAIESDRASFQGINFEILAKEKKDFPKEGFPFSNFNEGPYTVIILKGTEENKTFTRWLLFPREESAKRGVYIGHVDFGTNGDLWHGRAQGDPDDLYFGRYFPQDNFFAAAATSIGISQLTGYNFKPNLQELNKQFGTLKYVAAYDLEENGKKVGSVGFIYSPKRKMTEKPRSVFFDQEKNLFRPFHDPLLNRSPQFDDLPDSLKGSRWQPKLPPTPTS